ncbi:dystroglycan-type cadherin-like domain protein (macronuclear) [Tetrahymena thermophila SB210]|uniref:Dystroglycan-type cadherin-like domain protein n=1 Tax=Tetrahymena thermophila (strain SB210) TaxID=312017 RepID=Q241D2_TETTS|nr:dystroglycan-type cadherin-like domain protein [Tetrahymena thermophila SB210]EAS02376.2 dystroglycan-type cadherin-like domain protein [Tetrahymena thermophila SB210]|eukprot:XP_001022621.2 dystroglycan-type cadherin-like domain protein [Tetrahymena thermophila SB210]
MNFFQLYIFFNFLLEFLLCYDSRLYDNSLPVFEPFPKAVIDPTIPCKNGSSDVMTYFRSSQINLLAVSLQKCGFGIYDVTNVQEGVQLVNFYPYSPKKGQVLSLSITDSNKFIWVSYKSGFLDIQDVSQSQFPIVLTQNITFKDQQDYVMKVIQFQQFNLTFLACINNFKLISLANSNISIIQTVEVNDFNIYDIQFALQNSILCVQSYSLINFYQQSIEDLKKGKFNNICSYSPGQGSTLSSFQVIHENILVIQIQYIQYIMVDIQDYINSYDGITCDPSKIIQLDTYPSSPLGNKFALSIDQNFLYTQLSSIGVVVFDIRQKMLEPFQIIQTGGTCADLKLSDDGNYIFYSSWYNVQIFKKTIPNLNLDVPNLLLNNYQLVSNSFYKPPGGSFDNQMYFQTPENILYVSRYSYGSAFFQYKGNGILQLESQLNNNDSSISVSYQTRVPNTSIIYQSLESQGLQIVDCKDINAPKIVKTGITLGQSSYRFEQIEFNKKGNLAFVANLVNVIIIDTNDPLNPKVVSVINTSVYFEGDSSLYTLGLSIDEKTLILNPQDYGIAFADIQDPSNPYLFYKLNLGITYSFTLSSDGKYIFLCVSFQGIHIYGINSDRSITFVSKFSTRGVVGSALLLNNDNYLIISTEEIDSLILVSIVDKSNPVILQILSLPDNDPNCWLVAAPDYSYIFALSQLALYQCFLQSPIIFHSSIYKLKKISNSNIYQKELIPSNMTFQVGDYIQIYLVNIYQSKSVQIKKAQYYFNNVLLELPSWIQFSPQNQVLSIQTSNESLVAGSDGMYQSKSLQQVVFLCYQQLDDFAFVNQFLNINQEDSVKIKQICMNVGYLDSAGFVSSQYSPQNVFQFLDTNSLNVLQKWNQTQGQFSQVLSFIQITLNQNIINYTIQFYTQTSLIVDLSNSVSPISSNQNSIIVTINTSYGKFVNKLYSGILVLINSEQNTIQLQGSVINVNQALEQTIKLSLNNTQNVNQTEIQIIVNDQINYNYDQTLSLQKSKFISLQSPVLLKSILQNDFNNQFPKGQIAVQTPLSYRIGDQVFQCLDSPQLTYTAKIKKDDGQYENIPAGYWLSFQSNERTLVGTPSTNLFYQSETILIEATDGYTVASDEFTMSVTVIPFYLVIQIIIQILGPLLGILGIWKYRTVFYNLIFRYFLTYTKEVAYQQEYYEKKIFISGNTLNTAIQLWKEIQNQIKPKYIQQQINQVFNKQNSVIQMNVFHEQLNQKAETFNLQEEMKKSIYPQGILQVDDEVYEQILSPQNDENLTKIGDLQSVFSQENILKYQTPYKNQSQSRSQRKFKQSRLVTQSMQNKNYQEKITQNLCKDLNVKSIQQSQLNPNNNSLNLNFQLFESSGQINFKYIQELIILQQQTVNPTRRILTNKLQKELENENSLLSTMIKGLAAEYFVENYPIVKRIIILLQEKALIIFKKTDWYRAYVGLKQVQQDQEDYQAQYQLKYECIKLAFKEITEDMKKETNPQNQRNNNQEQLYNGLSVYDLSIYLPLIEQHLFAIALGVTIQKRKFFQVSFGDSFHCNSYQIRAIKFYEKGILCRCCVKAQELLGVDLVEKGLSENERLPEWMQINFQKSYIQIKGMPDQKSVGQYRIKIYDFNGYLLRQFDIQILPNQQLTNRLITKSPEIDSQQNIDTPKYQKFSQFNKTNFLLSALTPKTKSDEVLEEDDIKTSKIKNIINKSNSKNIDEQKFFTTQ